MAASKDQGVARGNALRFLDKPLAPFSPSHSTSRPCQMSRVSFAPKLLLESALQESFTGFDENLPYVQQNLSG
jgi:hypothetical protein